MSAAESCVALSMAAHDDDDDDADASAADDEYAARADRLAMLMAAQERWPAMPGCVCWRWPRCQRSTTGHLIAGHRHRF